MEEGVTAFERDERRDELQIRLFAVPVALAIALVFQTFAFGRFVQRAFFGMWLHELGHTIAAWLCGIPAFPGPWMTPMGDGRSWAFALLLSAALSALLWKHRRSEERPWLKWVLGLLLLLQMGCTLFFTTRFAQVFVLFGGDGGALIFGCLGMASLFVARDTALHRGWLRWGLLAIGAAAFVDVFTVWFRAQLDPSEIPFGMNEGVGLSDPSRLADDYGWTELQLINRSLTLGIVCLLVLLTLNVIAVLRARADLRAQ